MAVTANIFQTAAHKTKGLVIGTSFQLMDPLHSLLVKDITADPVNRIGGVTDDSPMLECLNNLGDEARLGVLRIDTDHKSVIWSWNKDG